MTKHSRRSAGARIRYRDKIHCWGLTFIVGVRLEEHDNITRASTTAMGDHLRDTGHTLDFSSSLIIERENDPFKRRIREAIEIHWETPTMNHDNGYELPPIYGDVLSRGFHHPKSRDKTYNTIT